MHVLSQFDVPAVSGRVMDGMHDIKHMITQVHHSLYVDGQCEGRMPYRLSYASAVLGVSMSELHVCPIFFARQLHLHRPAKGIRVGDADRTLCPIDLDKWQISGPYVEAGNNSSRCRSRNPGLRPHG